MRGKQYRIHKTISKNLTTSIYLGSRTTFRVASWPGAGGYSAWIVLRACTLYSQYPQRRNISAQSFQESAMTSRATRGSSAKEAAFIASSKRETNPQQLSSPPATPASVSTKKDKNPPAKTSAKKVTQSKVASKSETQEAAASTSAATKGAKKAAVKKSAVPSTSNTEQDGVPPTPASIGRKRKRGKELKVESNINELPHNLGTLVVAPSKDLNAESLDDGEGSNENAVKAKIEEESEDGKGAPSSSKKRKTRKASLVTDQAKDITSAAEKDTTDTKDPPAKKAKKPKANPYGITPGKTPYPEWTAPTPEQCHEVNDILSKMHGKVAAPEQIPVPSVTISGCGEVSSIHDALLRTLLSANTAGANAAKALQGLVSTFGVLSSGIGKGSVDWDAVRRAPLDKVTKAIKSGGMGDKKSAFIKKILDLVYEEGMARRDELITQGKASVEKVPTLPSDKDDDTSSPTITKVSADTPADLISIAKTNDNVLSLDHMHAWSTEDAFMKFIQYPGIGVKTASCVLLFCMRRPSFAVDTHVFRLCKWLGWVPENATRDKAYSHLEVRVPNELKYSLHQLFIRHGKSCPRCRAVTGEGSEGWAKGCPIDELVKRTGKRKVVKKRKQVTNGGKGKGKKVESEDEESELSELSDIASEDEGKARSQDAMDEDDE